MDKYQEKLKDHIKNKVQNIKVWKRHGEQAPHKPLLLLLALSRLSRGYDRLATFPSKN